MSKKKISIVTVRLTFEDFKMVGLLAGKEGESMSSWIRNIILKELVKQGNKKDSKHKIREYNR